MRIEQIKERLEAGDIGPARDELLEIVRADPSERRAWLLLAGIATRTDDWQLGERVFQALTGLRPTDALASSGLVQCLVRAKRYPEALQEINRFALLADKTKLSDQAVLAEHEAIALGMIKNGVGSSLE